MTVRAAAPGRIMGMARATAVARRLGWRGSASRITPAAPIAAWSRHHHAKRDANVLVKAVDMNAVVVRAARVKAILTRAVIKANAAIVRGPTARRPGSARFG
jgi:hypothetical protein